ncbi:MULTISPECIES: transcriptional regulator [Pseudomonas]|uniref:transcriptional regulator n=1 Tax=Pseudomonas TaxID=286 RepID=UPI000D6FF52B|nr:MULTISPECIES: transcriptional regulator [unclassified Pseudomonas]MED5609802.1 transcriptional regulator [Pseudomonas sp. JH-2]PWU28476.1 transcriptional regulator [Pseudomonas sp. RW407]
MPLRPTLALCALLALPLLAVADDQAPNPDQVMSEHKAEIDNRLADIDYKRKRIVEANMNLTDKEGEAFWPIYNTYRSEAEKLSKQHLALILDYARSYNTGKVADADASKLITRAEKLQQMRLDLRNRYITRMAKAVSPTRAMRFLQIETQLDAMALLDVSREIPLAE